jgi:hypothetical protein
VCICGRGNVRTPMQLYFDTLPGKWRITVVTHPLSPGDTAETNMAGSSIARAPHDLLTLLGLEDRVVFLELDLCASSGGNTITHLHLFTWSRD